jgi:hypothetical protein
VFLRLLAIVVLLLVVAYIGVTSTARNGGEFAYALDDTYIHLAVAKNLASSGTWGINPDAFSPCTSSIAWPILLALLGASAPWGIWVPLVLNLVLAMLLLWIADSWMAELGVGRIIRAGVLLGLVLVVPVGVLAILGLEHVAQVLLCILFMRWSVRRADALAPAWPGWLLAVALVSVRFEGIFLVAGVTWMFREEGRRNEGARLLLAGLLPFVVFGAASMALGARFFPTPIWMKGKLASELLPALRAGGSDPTLWIQFLLDFLIIGPARNLAEVGVLAWLVLLGLARLVWSHVRGVRLTALAAVLVATWMHLVFARTGWVGRYEAWLVALLAIMLAPTAQRFFDRAREGRWNLRLVLPVLLILFGLFPVRARVASTMFQANRGSTNIHEQQVQMARFLGAHRAGEAIGLNDIGAVGYFSGVEVVDLWGLSDVDVAERRLAGTLNPIEIGWTVQTRGVEVVAMYEDVLDETGGAPPDWVPVSDWIIRRNAVCGSSRVTWFASAPEFEARLRSELEAWAPELPATVTVRWR